MIYIVDSVKDLYNLPSNNEYKIKIVKIGNYKLILFC